MKKIKVTDAVGKRLAHDITKIIPGKFKDAAFRHNYLIKAEDVEELLKLGEDLVYVLDGDETDIHESQAGLAIAQSASGEGLRAEIKKEAWIDVIADQDGILKVDKRVLDKLNGIEEVIFATLPSYVTVETGMNVAKVKIRPLYIRSAKLQKILGIPEKHGKAIYLKKIHRYRTGLIIASTEVASGRIEDGFEKLIREKMAQYSILISDCCILPDIKNEISGKIVQYIKNGIEFIIVTGGMSVDPCDVTYSAIKQSGAKVINYGTPFSPGAMLLIACLDSVPIVGVPSGALHRKRTSFDVMLPRILGGEKITRKDIRSMGEGGLCWNCMECFFPRCSFGR